MIIARIVLIDVPARHWVDVALLLAEAGARVDVDAAVAMASFWAQGQET